MPCAWDRLQLFLLARLQLFLLVNGGVDLRGDHTLLATGGETSDQNISFLIDGIPDLLAHSVLRALEVIPGVAVVVHEGEEVVVHPDELEVLALHVGHFHVVCGGADVLKLLASEDVKGDEMDLGVAVLASLGGGHLHDLARTVLDHDEAALPERRALHGESLGGSRVSLVEVVVLVVGHFAAAVRFSLKKCYQAV